MIKDILRYLSRQEYERGQALAEYGLVLAFVAISCIVLLGLLGLAIVGHIDSITVVFP